MGDSNDRVLNFVAGGQAGGNGPPGHGHAVGGAQDDLDIKPLMTAGLGSPVPGNRNVAFSIGSDAQADIPPVVPPLGQGGGAVGLGGYGNGNTNGSSLPDRKRSAMSMSVASSVDDDDFSNTGIDRNDPDREKKLERLKKNREIARNCRKRKRERMAQLEEEVVKLREWNRQLEMKLNKGKEGKDREDIRIQEMKNMKKLLQSNTSESEMKSKMESYAEMYSDFGRERKAAINFHMSKLKSLLLPNQVSKMTLWSLQQDDEFYDEKRNQKTFGGSIWNMLCESCRLTNDQKKDLIRMRGGINKQRKNLAECLRILGELENRIEENFQSLAEQMTTLMSITTPTQQARFLLWIENNQACMHMLNNLWNQKGSNLPGAPPKDEPSGAASSGEPQSGAS